MHLSVWKATMPFVYCTMAPSAGHASRHPGSAQCMHWSFRISHMNVPFSFVCSWNRIRFQKFHDVSGIVWYVLSNVVDANGRSFHSWHAISQALQPMHVVVSTSLHTCFFFTSRYMPSPGTAPEWPDIFWMRSVAWLMVGLRYAFSSFTRKPLNSGVCA